MTIWNSDSHTNAVIRCWGVNENINVTFLVIGVREPKKMYRNFTVRRHDTRLRNECNG